jgi:hypothetical protein
VSTTRTTEEIAASRWRTVAGVLWLLSLLALLAVLGVLLALAVGGLGAGEALNGRLAGLALVGTALFYAGSAVRRHADRTDPAQPLARPATGPTRPEMTP